MQGARHKSVQIGVTQSEYECAGNSVARFLSGSRHDLLGTTRSKERLADVFESVRRRRKNRVRRRKHEARVATRFTGYSWGGQRSEVRGRTTEDGRQEPVLKNVESLKALQSYNREGELPARGESGRPGGRSNQRIMTNLEAL